MNLLVGEPGGQPVNGFGDGRGTVMLGVQNIIRMSHLEFISEQIDTPRNLSDFPDGKLALKPAWVRPEIGHCQDIGTIKKFYAGRSPLTEGRLDGVNLS
jgi:hypothetical protein